MLSRFATLYGHSVKIRIENECPERKLDLWISCLMKSSAVFQLENAGGRRFAGWFKQRFAARTWRLFGPSGRHWKVPPLARRPFGPTENNMAPEQFLAQWERSPSPSVSLKVRSRAGAPSHKAAAFVLL